MRAIVISLLLVVLSFIVGHFLGAPVMRALGLDTGTVQPTGTEAPEAAPAPQDNPGDAPGSSNNEPDPDPYEGDVLAKLGGSLGGQMSNGEFRAQGGLGAHPVNDIEADCDVTGFELVYVGRRDDPVPSANAGARFNDRSRSLIEQAQPGDIYYFTNVRVRCDGNTSSRAVNTLVFSIR